MKRTNSSLRKLLVLLLMTPAVLSSYSTAAQQKSSNAENTWVPQYKAPRKSLLPLKHPVRRGNRATERLRHWNEVAINASGLDHALFREQLGPGRSAKAMAIIHIAIFEALGAAPDLAGESVPKSEE